MVCMGQQQLSRKPADGVHGAAIVRKPADGAHGAVLVEQETS